MRWSVLCLVWFGCSTGSKDADVPPVDDTDEESDDTDPGTTDTLETDVPDSDSDAESDEESDSVDSDPVADTATPAPPTSTLLAGGPVACTNPNARAARGMFERVRVSVPAVPRMHVEGANAVLGDLDNDGDEDAVIVSMDRVAILWNTRTIISNRPDVILRDSTTTDIRGYFGATLVDIDGDGWLDILATGRGIPSHMMRNEQNRTFTDVTAAVGLDGYDTHHSTGASFADYDQDGDLDLFIGGHGYIDETLSAVAYFLPGEPSRLYRNDAGFFTDVSYLLPQRAHDGYTFMGGWIDADSDGDEDLYLVNDFGGSVIPCVLVRNEGSAGFVMDNNALGMDFPVAGMGFGVGDFNGDGLEEVAIPAWNRNVFLTRYNGIWFDEAQSRGYVPNQQQTVAWGTEAADVDNDGLLDLVTAYGKVDVVFGANNNPNQPDSLHLQLPNGQFIEAAPTYQFDDYVSHRGIAVGDHNADGWIDFLKMGFDGYLRVYTSRCGTEAWSTILLRDQAPNTYAVGAEIEIEVGGDVQTRRVRAGGTGYGGGQPYRQHFGLGPGVTRIDRLTVRWPDGVRETWTNVAASQHLRIRR